MNRDALNVIKRVLDVVREQIESIAYKQDNANIKLVIFHLKKAGSALVDYFIESE